MRRRIFAFIIFLLAITSLPLVAQEETLTLSLTVDQAVEYALEHNRSVASARYDLLASEKAIWEAIAAGLPSIDGSASLSNNLAVMTRIINFGGVPTTIKFGSAFDVSYGASASMVVFSAPWLVGIQTARLAAKLAEQGLTQTRIETEENVINVYHVILTLKETLRILDQNLQNLNETLASTKTMYSVGMAEATDVDQMQSNVTMLSNNISSMKRALEVNYNMLRFLLGVDRATEIVLTENLENILARIDVEELSADEFDIKSNINYQLIESQVEMSMLSLKGAKAAVLPTIAGSINYIQNGLGDELFHMKYYPYSMAGLQMQIPIFGSGTRYTKIKKAQINLEKAVSTRDMMSEQLLMQEKQLRYNLLNASEQYKSQKENIIIAERVLQSFENKYNQGMASSLELTQANNNYLTAQSNYISAVMNLLQTKVAFDRLMNRF